MTMTEVTTRTCTKCKRDLSRTLEEFPANRRMKDGLSSWCRVCHRTQVNRDPEKARHRARIWAQKNPERARERLVKWREANPERQKANDRSWRERNPERVIANTRAWREANPERYRIIMRAVGARRRAAERSAQGSSTAQQIIDRIAYYGGLCWMCGAPWEHLDHVIPLSRGGSNWPSNLRPACAPCNLRKGNKEILSC